MFYQILTLFKFLKIAFVLLQEACLLIFFLTICINSREGVGGGGGWFSIGTSQYVYTNKALSNKNALTATVVIGSVIGIYVFHIILLPLLLFKSINICVTL